MAKQPTQTRVRRKEKKNVTNAVAHVNSSFNNTVITITDIQGNAISWSSSGTMGFKGSRKSTPYAAQLAAEDAGKKASDHGVNVIPIHLEPKLLLRELLPPVAITHPLIRDWSMAEHRVDTDFCRSAGAIRLVA